MKTYQTFWAAGLAAIAGLAGPTARAAAPLPQLRLESAAGPTVAPGQVAAIDLYLRGGSTSTIASIELGFDSLSSGATYVASSPNTDGFAESPVVTTYLSAVNDGSLLDNTFLGFAAGPADDGISASASLNQLLGTLYVQIPLETSTGTLIPVVISTSELLDTGLNVLPTQVPANVTLTVSVPEPSTVGTFGLLMLALRRRRSVPVSVRTSVR